MSQGRSLFALAVACAMGAMGALVFLALPLLIGLIIGERGYTEQQAGLIASSYFATYFLASASSFLWIDRLRRGDLPVYGGGHRPGHSQSNTARPVSVHGGSWRGWRNIVQPRHQYHLAATTGRARFWLATGNTAITGRGLFDDELQLEPADDTGLRRLPVSAVIASRADAI